MGCRKVRKNLDGTWFQPSAQPFARPFGRPLDQPLMRAYLDAWHAIDGLPYSGRMETFAASYVPTAPSCRATSACP